jgi:histidinol-phosphate phosphatase family protein
LTKLARSAGDYLALMAETLTAIDGAEVAGLASALWDLWERDATLLICGNGGSASTGSHMASDLRSQTRVASRNPLKALCLTDNVASLTAWANDAGFDQVFAEQVRTLGRAGDGLLCISCSGTSANIVAAMHEARSRGMSILAFGGFAGGVTREMADAYVHVPSDDYGMVESAHLVIDHCITALLHVEAENARQDGIEADASKPVVIIDRDGVINRNLDQGVRSWDDFEFLPGALEGLATLKRQGHRVVVVTNQANLARGLLTPAQLENIHRRMLEAVADADAAIEAIYVCQHHPNDGCECRKPAPGLLLRASQELGFDLANSYLIGDHHSDVDAAQAAGAKAVLALSGRHSTADAGPAPAYVVRDLLGAVELVTGLHNGRTPAAAVGG